MVLEGNKFLKFYGHWIDGELLTFPGCTQRLLNEDEKRDYVASTRSIRIFSDTTNWERKNSTEYMKTPSASSEESSEMLSSAESEISSPAEIANNHSSKSTSNRQHPPKQKYTLGEVASPANSKLLSSVESLFLSSAECSNRHCSSDSEIPSPGEFAHKHSFNRSSSRQHPHKQKYTLGEVARSPSHMVIYRSKEKAIQSASRLNKYDQAFIKRSNGLW